MCPICEKKDLPQSQWPDVESIFIEVFRDEFLELSPDELKYLLHRVYSAESLEDVKVTSMDGEMNCDVIIDPAWIAVGLNFIQTVLQFIALKQSSKKTTLDSDVKSNEQRPSFDDFLKYAENHISESSTLKKYGELMDEYFKVYELFMMKREEALNSESCSTSKSDDIGEEI